MKTIIDRILTWAGRSRKAFRHTIQKDSAAPTADTKAEVAVAANADMKVAANAEMTAAISAFTSALAELRAELAEVKAELAVIRAEQAAAKVEQVVAKVGQVANCDTHADDVTASSDRSAVIRFNKQFLTSHYDLRYNMQKRATEFRPKHPVGLPASIASGGFAAGTEPPPPPESLPRLVHRHHHRPPPREPLAGAGRAEGAGR